MCVCLCVGLCTCGHAMRVCGHIGCWCVSVSAHFLKARGPPDTCLSILSQPVDMALLKPIFALGILFYK